MGSSNKIGSTDIKNISHLDASYVNNWDTLMGDSISLWLHVHTHRAWTISLMARALSAIRGLSMREYGV